MAQRLRGISLPLGCYRGSGVLATRKFDDIIAERGAAGDKGNKGDSGILQASVGKS